MMATREFASAPPASSRCTRVRSRRCFPAHRTCPGSVAAAERSPSVELTMGDAHVDVRRLRGYNRRVLASRSSSRSRRPIRTCSPSRCSSRSSPTGAFPSPPSGWCTSPTASRSTARSCREEAWICASGATPLAEHPRGQHASRSSARRGSRASSCGRSTARCSTAKCAASPAAAASEEPAASAVWRPSADSGVCRRTSAAATRRSRATATRSICSRSSARAFGFPRAIAHGMWTLARCVAAARALPARRVHASR